MNPREPKGVFPFGTMIALCVVLSLFFLLLQAVPSHRMQDINEDPDGPPRPMNFITNPPPWNDTMVLVTTKGWPATIRVDVFGRAVHPGNVWRHSFAGMALNLLFLALCIGAVVSWTCWGFYRPGQPRFAFRLRTLFLLMALVAILLGGWKLADRLSKDVLKAAMEEVRRT